MTSEIWDPVHSRELPLELDPKLEKAGRSPVDSPVWLDRRTLLIEGDKLLPLKRFLPKPKIPEVKQPSARGGQGGAGAPHGRGGFEQDGGSGGHSGAKRGGMRAGFGSGQGGGMRGGRTPSGAFRGRGRRS